MSILYEAVFKIKNKNNPPLLQGEGKTAKSLHIQQNQSGYSKHTPSQFIPFCYGICLCPNPLEYSRLSVFRQRVKYNMYGMIHSQEVGIHNNQMIKHFQLTDLLARCNIQYMQR